MTDRSKIDRIADALGIKKRYLFLLVVGLVAFFFMFSFLGIFFLFGIIAFFGSLYWIKLSMMIRNIPTSKIRSLAMGLVEINGRAVPVEGKALKAPFSGKDCVYYEYLVQRYRTRGKGDGWVNVAHGTQREIFYLQDETGMVLVDPDKAIVEVGNYFELKDANPPVRVKEFLSSKQIPLVDPSFRSKQVRFVEHTIPANENIYVLGTAGDNPFVGEANSAHSVKDVMIQRGKNDRFYLISDKPEKTYLKKLRRRIIGGLIFGIVMMAFMALTAMRLAEYWVGMLSHIFP